MGGCAAQFRGCVLPLHCRRKLAYLASALRFLRRRLPGHGLRGSLRAFVQGAALGEGRTAVNESKKQCSSLFIGISADFVSFLFASEAMFFFVNRHYSSPSPLATGRKACRRAAAILSQPAYHHTKPASRGTCRATAVKPRPTLMLLYAPARSDGCRALALPCQKAGGKGKKKIVAATVAVRVQKLACCV